MCVVFQSVDVLIQSRSLRTRTSHLYVPAEPTWSRKRGTTEAPVSHGVDIRSGAAICQQKEAGFHLRKPQNDVGSKHVGKILRTLHKAVCSRRVGCHDGRVDAYINDRTS